MCGYRNKAKALRQCIIGEPADLGRAIRMQQRHDAICTRQPVQQAIVIEWRIIEPQPCQAFAHVAVFKQGDATVAVEHDAPRRRPAG